MSTRQLGHPLVAALDVGGTHVAGALVAVDESRLLEATRRTATLDPLGDAASIITALLACAAQLPAAKGVPWGVAFPGPMDYEAGIGLFDGIDNNKFGALAGCDLRRVLVDGLDRAPGVVRFINDAEAFLLGECFSGAARGRRRVVGVTLGTGIGSAFAVDGNIVSSGRGVPPEGFVYRLRYQGAPLEHAVSREAIRRSYAEEAGLDDAGPDVREITALARRGDPVAKGIMDRAMAILGGVLGPLLAEFEADVLVVGGAMARSWDIVRPPLVAAIERSGPTASSGFEVARAHHLEDAPLFGAAWHAARAAERDGSSRS